MVMQLPDGQCHRSVAALLMYVRCGWTVLRRKTGTYNQYTEVTEAQMKGLLASGREELEEAHATHPGRRAEELRSKCVCTNRYRCEEARTVDMRRSARLQT